MSDQASDSCADGRPLPYADLSGIAKGTIDDMIVDGLGRAYVGGTTAKAVCEIGTIRDHRCCD
jgi:hypothetical protein